MLRYFVIATFGILASVSVALADEDDVEGLHAYFLDTKVKCMAEFEMDEDELKDIKKNKQFDKIDPCFIACVMKEKKVIDDNGMFDDKQAYEIAEKFIKDSDKLGKVKKMGKACLSVNDADVSDGAKGCDRSVQLMQCFVENADIFKS